VQKQRFLLDDKKFLSWVHGKPNQELLKEYVQLEDQKIELTQKL
jgi:hypothetical protein